LGSSSTALVASGWAFPAIHEHASMDILIQNTVFHAHCLASVVAYISMQYVLLAKETIYYVLIALNTFEITDDS